MLVHVLVRHDLALQFGRRVVTVVAACRLRSRSSRPKLFGRMRSMLLRVILPVVKACPWITVGVSHSTTDTFCATIALRSSVPPSPNCAASAPADAMAEIVLAAGVELHVGRKHAAVFVEEADKAAVVVDMAVADDHRLDLGRIDLEQAHVVDDRRRGIAEVEQDRAVARRRAAIRDRATGPTRCAARCARPRCVPGPALRAQRRSRCCRAGTGRAAGRPARGSRACRRSARRSARRWRTRRRRTLPADAAAKAAEDFRKSRRPMPMSALPMRECGSATVRSLTRNARQCRRTTRRRSLRRLRLARRR